MQEQRDTEPSITGGKVMFDRGRNIVIWVVIGVAAGAVVGAITGGISGWIIGGGLVGIVFGTLIKRRS